MGKMMLIQYWQQLVDLLFWLCGWRRYLNEVSELHVRYVHHTAAYAVIVTDAAGYPRSGMPAPRLAKYPGGVQIATQATLDVRRGDLLLTCRLDANEGNLLCIEQVTVVSAHSFYVRRLFELRPGCAIASESKKLVRLLAQSPALYQALMVAQAKTVLPPTRHPLYLTNSRYIPWLLPPTPEDLNHPAGAQQWCQVFLNEPAGAWSLRQEWLRTRVKAHLLQHAWREEQSDLFWEEDSI